MVRFQAQTVIIVYEWMGEVKGWLGERMKGREILRAIMFPNYYSRKLSCNRLRPKIKQDLE